MKLSNARSRAELIASHAYGQAFATPPPPPAAKQPPEDAPGEEKPEAPAGGDADASVLQAVHSIKQAVDAAIKAQAADPDADDPKDKTVAQGLQKISDQVGQLLQDQAKDAAEPADPDDAKPAPPKPEAEKPAVAAAGVAPEVPETNPVDAEGNVQPDAKCANPDCGHLAANHANMPGGENTGGCELQSCECLAMQIETQSNTGNGDSGEQNDTSAEEKLAVADAPAPIAPAKGEEPDLNKPPETEGGENMGPSFTIPVGVIENQDTGDGRRIGPEALDWRLPPLPLMGLATATHDPNGFDMNDPSVLCGRIDSLERVPGEGDTQVIQAKGYFLANEDGQYFAALAESMGRIGISADVAVEAEEATVGQVDETGFPVDMSMTLTKGTIMGFTIVPFPAFEGAYLVLGGGTGFPDARIPQKAEATVPDEPPSIVANGGQLIHLMAYEECEPCAQGRDIIASAAPTRPPKAWFENPNFHPEDGRMVEILDRRGKRVIGGKFACPLTVEESGRVYGHIAPWGICHTGSTGQCILAPRSKADYAHFKRGQHIVTAEGEKVRVGVLTADAGHASTRGISASQAMAHYDNTALAVADVNIGEDEHGIWVAGALRPGATQEQVRKLTAASISGDWRQIGGSLELVAALAVNQPGFPLAQVASGHHEALVAAGATVMAHLKQTASEDNSDPAVRAIRHFEHKRKLLRLVDGEAEKARARLRLVR